MIIAEKGGAAAPPYLADFEIQIPRVFTILFPFPRTMTRGFQFF
jgi:hypothetical protein